MDRKNPNSIVGDTGNNFLRNIIRDTSYTTGQNGEEIVIPSYEVYQEKMRTEQKNAHNALKKIQHWCDICVLLDNEEYLVHHITNFIKMESAALVNYCLESEIYEKNKVDATKRLNAFALAIKAINEWFITVDEANQRMDEEIDIETGCFKLRTIFVEEYENQNSQAEAMKKELNKVWRNREGVDPNEVEEVIQKIEQMFAKINPCPLSLTIDEINQKIQESNQQPLNSRIERFLQEYANSIEQAWGPLNDFINEGFFDALQLAEMRKLPLKDIKNAIMSLDTIQSIVGNTQSQAKSLIVHLKPISKYAESSGQDYQINQNAVYAYEGIKEEGCEKGLELNIETIMKKNGLDLLLPTKDELLLSFEWFEQEFQPIQQGRELSMRFEKLKQDVYEKYDSFFQRGYFVAIGQLEANLAYLATHVQEYRSHFSKFLSKTQERLRRLKEYAEHLRCDDVVFVCIDTCAKGCEKITQEHSVSLQNWCLNGIPSLQQRIQQEKQQRLQRMGYPRGSEIPHLIMNYVNFTYIVVDLPIYPSGVIEQFTELQKIHEDINTLSDKILSQWNG